MHILIVLATMTNLGTYPTQARCEAAVRSIYEQRLDPYRLLPKAALKSLLDNQMQYVAPTEYLCRKI
jgi:hypothetical protein